jgi:hypothetical protein
VEGRGSLGVGAIGMAQFMPSTATWIAGVYPDLQPPAPTNPAWAMRALTQYDRHLYERIVPAADACERMAFALSQYNGGTTAGDVQACRSGQVECVALIEIPAEARHGRSDSSMRCSARRSRADQGQADDACACDPARWFDNVEKFNGRRRSEANFRENRGYPVRILKTLSPAYVKANWGTASCSV